MHSCPSGSLPAGTPKDVIDAYNESMKRHLRSDYDHLGAVLETAINTDVPGYVRAVVSADVRFLPTRLPELLPAVVAGGAVTAEVGDDLALADLERCFGGGASRASPRRRR